MNETLEYLQMFARFPFALRRFLKHTLTLEEARQIVRERMEHREENFLRVVERSIYGYPRSPYLALLKMAGCEMSDLRAMVKQKGLEGALRQLREEGVYVTFEEFKGRKPIVRNGTIIPVTARDFDNRFAHNGFTMSSGGSTGLANTVRQDLDYVASSAVDHLLMLDAHQAVDLPTAQWTAILPGAGLHFVLQRAYLRLPQDQWFSPIGWTDSKYWVKYGLASLYMISCLRALNANIPSPKVVRGDAALSIARWMRDALDESGQCLVYSNVSHAVRLCLAAEQAGFDLADAVIRVGGEPVTEAKLKAMHRVGVKAIVTYGSIEANGIGLGCARPMCADEVHLASDVYAMISSPLSIGGFDVTVSAFNLTTLLDSSPKVMLNYQIDDYGITEERACGCALDSLGLSAHLSEIRSHSKLVGEGVTLIGNEMLRILEDVLPSRFGGSALDYQFAEEEDAQGLTRLYLNISPRVEIPDEQQVIQVVLAAMSASSPMADAARTVWKDARTLQIERREPTATIRGKVMPLHIRQSQKNS